MAIAPRNQSRRQGSVTLLMPAPPASASPLASCLAQLQGEWRAAGNLAALWQAWPKIAGPQLAPHCRPLSLRSGRLAVGASHPQWLQALRYNKHQLLGALRGAGFSVRDLTIQLHYPAAGQTAGALSEAAIWAAHPSRVDVHGLGTCPHCGRPAPNGEMGRWGHCSFCQRHESGLLPEQAHDPLGEGAGDGESAAPG
jgi:predicted nucleic acid-binding Zn ribbon protein